MWLYEKRLQYPVNVRKPDAKTAKIVISQLGGPNGELGAALRYLNQRYTMPYPRIQALLTDIGTEELAHVEIISTLFYQLINDRNKVESYGEITIKDTIFVDAINYKNALAQC